MDVLALRGRELATVALAGPVPGVGRPGFGARSPAPTRSVRPWPWPTCAGAPGVWKATPWSSRLVRVGGHDCDDGGAGPGVDSLLNGRSQLALAAEVGGGAIVGAMVYLAACRALGITEVSAMLRRNPAGVPA